MMRCALICAVLAPAASLEMNSRLLQRAVRRHLGNAAAVAAADGLPGAELVLRVVVREAPAVARRRRAARRHTRAHRRARRRSRRGAYARRASGRESPRARPSARGDAPRAADTQGGGGGAVRAAVGRWRNSHLR